MHFSVLGQIVANIMLTPQKTWVMLILNTGWNEAYGFIISCPYEWQHFSGKESKTINLGKK